MTALVIMVILTGRDNVCRPDHRRKGKRMTSNYVIEKNVPLAQTAGAPAKYPFLEMEIGDSFLVTDRARPQVGAAAGNAGKFSGRKFTTRTVPGGVRVWRVA